MIDPLPTKLLALMAPRTGHFQLESGHHGELWLDLDALFVRPSALQPFVVELAQRLRQYNPDAVCGPITGGALLAQMIAVELRIEFYYADRFASETKGARYRIPPAQRQPLRGKSVVLVDDVINAGAAIRATIADLHDCGARPVAIASQLVLGDAAFALAGKENIPVECIARLANRIWEPAECPLCAAGVGLEV